LRFWPIIQETKHKKPECEVSLEEMAFCAGMTGGCGNKFGKRKKVFFGGCFENEKGRRGGDQLGCRNKIKPSQNTILRGLLRN
jgi:hypothetical protein